MKREIYKPDNFSWCEFAIGVCVGVMAMFILFVGYIYFS